MTEIDILESVLGKTGDIIAGVGDDQLTQPTPCSEYDVAALRNHVVGWSQAFAAASVERPFEGDAMAYAAGDDPVGDFRAAAADIVRGWRDHGMDRDVTISGGSTPGAMVFNMTMMEYVAHGWDLATATGQPITYTDTEATEALARAEATLLDAYRGDSFGPRIPVADDATAIDRYVAFMGRHPQT